MPVTTTSQAGKLSSQRPHKRSRDRELSIDLRSLQCFEVVQDHHWKQEALPDGLVCVLSQVSPQLAVLEQLDSVDCCCLCIIDEVAIEAVRDLHL